MTLRSNGMHELRFVMHRGPSRPVIDVKKGLQQQLITRLACPPRRPRHTTAFELRVPCASLGDGTALKNTATPTADTGTKRFYALASSFHNQQPNKYHLSCQDRIDRMRPAASSSATRHTIRHGGTTREPLAPIVRILRHVLMRQVGAQDRDAFGPEAQVDGDLRRC
jgi:hypothetical protein